MTSVSCLRKRAYAAQACLSLPSSPEKVVEIDVMDGVVISGAPKQEEVGLVKEDEDESYG